MRFRLGVVLFMLWISGTAMAQQVLVRVSTVANNGMPRDIVTPPNRWNFGSGSLWTHKGWQYAAYWDDARQVSVARRQLPQGNWSVVSLPDYQRTETGDRGKGGAISRGFGDGHEKVSMGISPDGVIHLSFDHHLSTLRYRRTLEPVANNPSAYPWTSALFGPVQNHLGGKKIVKVTYPSFTSDGTHFALYLRLNGGSGAADSHFFAYQDGRWIVNDEPSSKLIDKHWSGGDKTVNAYPHEMVIRNGRRYLTWSWRDTPDPRTSHDLCFAYSDDHGKTWRNNAGEIVAEIGKTYISADTPGIVAVSVASGTEYINGGSMAVDGEGGVHVLMRGEDGDFVLFQRDPETVEWRRRKSPANGVLVVGSGGGLYFVSPSGLKRTLADGLDKLDILAPSQGKYFRDSKMVADRTRSLHDGWISMIGQTGKTVTVIDFGTNLLPPPGSIEIADEQINFGQVEVNRSTQSTVMIRNEGTGPLTVSQVQSLLDGVSFDFKTFTIPSGGSHNLVITMRPSKAGSFTGNIEILSNDPDRSTLSVALIGEAVVIPPNPRADFDGNGVVDFVDFLGFASAFGSPDLVYDIDSSGVVDFRDFLVFAQSFGKLLN